MSKLHALFDADFIVYAAGFSAASVTYQVMSEGILVHEEQYMKDAKALVSSISKESPLRDVTIEKYTDAGPLSHSLSNLNTMVRHALEAVQCDSYQLYLSKGKTFRDNIVRNAEYLYNGKNKIYKGNRVDAERPLWYDKMVQHLVDQYQAKICKGIEADDAVAIQQTSYAKANRRSVIISADKDLNTVPGLHYNPMKKIRYNVTEDDADTWFWCQMIMGDSADNLTGIPKKGVKAAQNLLLNCSGHESRRKVVMDAYYAHYKDIPFATVQEIVQDNMNLLHMLREYSKHSDGSIKLRY